MNELFDVLVSWLGTYALHSTIVVAGVWLFLRLFSQTTHSTRDLLWKVALVGPVLTATLQVAFEVRPVIGSISLAGGGSDPSVEHERAIASGPDSSVTGDFRGVVVVDHGDIAMIHIQRGGFDGRPQPTATEVVAPQEPLGRKWPALIVAAFVIGASISLVRLGSTAARMRKALADRREVLEDPLLETLITLRQRTGVRRRVRLTASTKIHSPAALWHWEICVPERAVEGLDPRQQECMLAHELAHLVRRDPPWLLVAAIIEAVFFFQPLNRIAHRHMRQSAEILCDDWAVRHTGSGVHLARCLAEVASWLERGQSLGRLAGAMAEKNSPLVDRVQRLLGQPTGGAPAGPPARIGLAVVIVLALVAVAPGVSTAASPEPRPNDHEPTGWAFHPAPLAHCNTGRDPFEDACEPFGRMRSKQLERALRRLERTRSKQFERAMRVKEVGERFELHIERLVERHRRHALIDRQLAELERQLDALANRGWLFAPPPAWERGLPPPPGSGGLPSPMVLRPPAPPVPPAPPLKTPHAPNENHRSAHGKSGKSGVEEGLDDSPQNAEEEQWISI